MTKNITITESEYNRLLARDAHLEELQARGVDNWGEYVGDEQGCVSCGEWSSWSHESCPECKTKFDEE